MNGVGGLLAASNPSSDVWGFRAHPAVWVLVAGLVAGYVYMVRVIAPAYGRSIGTTGQGAPGVSRRQVMFFVAGMAVLWLSTDYPMHDLADQYLYSAHMFQHMALSYFAPPLLLLSVPEWFGRVLVGNGRGYRVVRFLAQPVTAFVLFSVWLVVTHIPGMVNAATSNLVLHYAMHAILVTVSLLMWIPVCGPFPEMRLQPAPMMLYLFAQSFIPTVPAGWLTFAEGVVYKSYDHAVRVWGVSVQSDQQVAGGIMKLGGSAFLWVVMTVIFFRRLFNGKTWDSEQRFQKLEDVEAARQAELDELLGSAGSNR